MENVERMRLCRKPQNGYKVTDLLDNSSTPAHVKRILVMDGGANGVKTL